MAENTAAPAGLITETQESLYEKAKTRMAYASSIVQFKYLKENYRRAEEMLEELGDYQDAPELARQCRELIQKAEKDEREFIYSRCEEREKTASTEDQWQKIKDALVQVGDYKEAAAHLKTADSKLKKFQRKHRIKRTLVFAILGAVLAGTAGSLATGYYRMLLGKMFISAGMESQARHQFLKLNGRFGSDALAAQAEYGVLKQAEEGDSIPYGKYTWKVLDRKEDSILLVESGQEADSGLKNVPFSNPSAEKSFQGYTAAAVEEDAAGTAAAIGEAGSLTRNPAETDWADSSLRAWLNSDMLENGFNEEERSHLLMQRSEPTENKNYGTAYKDATEDYVTILDPETALAYADPVSSLNGDWWLRCPGSDMTRVTFMSADHQIMTDGYPADAAGIRVRPVICLDISWLDQKKEDK